MVLHSRRGCRHADRQLGLQRLGAKGILVRKTADPPERFPDRDIGILGDRGPLGCSKDCSDHFFSQAEVYLSHVKSRQMLFF